MGPTGVGKTPVCVELAEHFRSEIISCDSRQIYREMKVGTAVPSDSQLAKVKHHFIGVKSIHNYYNASMFEFEVLDLLNQLFQNHKVVFMAGGSGLYIDAVCKGIDDLPTVNEELRSDLLAQYQREGIGYLRMQLKMLDPEFYKVVDLKNHKRMLKAIEISLITGRPYSTFLSHSSKERNFYIHKIGLNIERELLYKMIENRVDQMVEHGLVHEAKQLLPYKHLNALNTVGYKELFGYLREEYSLETAVDLIKRNSRRYARRQLSWFRRDKEIKWFCPQQVKDIIKYLEKEINNWIT